MPSRLDAFDVAVYRVPTPAPESDGTLTWDHTTMVAVHAHAGDRTGFGWTFAAPAAADVIRDLFAPHLTGLDAMDVPGCFAAMRRVARNAIVPGVVMTAISAVDVALWDLKARLLGVPLVSLFGRARDEVPVYGSGGFTSLTDDELRDQVGGWARGDGIPRVKIKIGERSGTRVDRDLHRMALVREAIGGDAELYVDANGGYTAKQAIRVADAVRDLDVRWFEEPVSSDDLAGLALVRDRVRCDVAAGEYGTEALYFRRMCEAGAVDCLQADATRCGGYTGFLAAATIAEAYGLEVSAHCAPRLHAPVAAAVPNLRHVEWFADHVRIGDLVFDGALSAHGGVMRPATDRPGHGIALTADAERYRVNTKEDET
ncbi:MAG TPA: enolase C-terminal domain-like protein [Micromonosporaceae bacterium]